MREHGKLLRSASLVTSLTLLSRVFGFVREQRVSFLLGASLTGDAFTIAYVIPNLLRRLVGEGAVSAAFIPLFSRYLSDDRSRNEAWEFANAVLTILTFVMAVVTVLGIVFAPFLVRIVAMGAVEIPGKIETATILTRIMFPYIFLISLAALAMGVLNSLHKFAAPAFAPVLLNVSIITFSFLTDLFPTPGIALAVGVVVGGVAQVAIQVPQLLRSGWKIRPLLALAHPGVRRAGRLLTPMIAAAGIVQVNVVVDFMFTSFMGDGPTFALRLADRVMELVLGGYAIAIGTVVLPMLSRDVAEGRMVEMRSTVNFAARIILFITVPASVGLIILREPIIQVLFEHGEFDAADTALTAFALVFFAAGLAAFSMMKVIVPAFYALQDTRTPVKIAFVAMLLNIGLNFAFFSPLQVGGPALATALAGCFNAATLTVLFARRQGSIGVRSIVNSFVRFLLASAALGAVAGYLIDLPGFYYGQGLERRIMALLATVAAAMVVYFVATWLLRCRELGELRSVFGGGVEESES